MCVRRGAGLEAEAAPGAVAGQDPQLRPVVPGYRPRSIFVVAIETQGTCCMTQKGPRRNKNLLPASSLQEEKEARPEPVGAGGRGWGRPEPQPRSPRRAQRRGPRGAATPALPPGPPSLPSCRPLRPYLPLPAGFLRPSPAQRGQSGAQARHAPGATAGQGPRAARTSFPAAPDTWTPGADADSAQAAGQDRHSPVGAATRPTRARGGETPPTGWALRGEGRGPWLTSPRPCHFLLQPRPSRAGRRTSCRNGRRSLPFQLAAGGASGGLPCRPLAREPARTRDTAGSGASAFPAASPPILLHPGADVAPAGSARTDAGLEVAPTWLRGTSAKCPPGFFL